MVTRIKNYNCPICLNIEKNCILKVKELMFQFPERFRYVHCSECGCLSLLDIPEDMGKYYPENYYSYTVDKPHNGGLKHIKKIINKSAMKAKLGYGNIFDKLTYKIKRIYFPWLKTGMVKLDSKILDVGCGNGFLVKEMQAYGFSSLTGIDPFLKQSTRNGNVKLISTNITSFEEDKFDLIMYHHSFEHLQFPQLELSKIHDKLNDSGTLLIRVPVCDSYAFRKYRENWVQLDAPRHYFLYTETGMKNLANKIGFEVFDIVYDSNGFQFSGSECYLRGKLASEQNNIFSVSKLQEFQNQAQELNLNRDGDTVCFFLRKGVG